MAYPKSTKFNNWTMFRETQKGRARWFVIRRWVIFLNGSKKLERLPVTRYKSLRDDIKELEQFIIRLNQDIPKEQRTIQAVEIRHALF